MFRSWIAHSVLALTLASALLVGYRLDALTPLVPRPAATSGGRLPAGVVAVQMNLETLFTDQQRMLGLGWPASGTLGMIMASVVLVMLAAGYLTWRDGRHRFRVDAEVSQKAHLERSHAELRALNAKLESAAHEWRTTVDAIDAAIVVLEPAGRILRMNRAAAAMLPDTLTAWLNQPSERLAGHEPWGAALALASNGVGRDSNSTARVQDAKGCRTWDLSCRAVRGSQSQQAVVVVVRDITAIVELQKSVRRSETMAELGSVVAGVAHEVRNPLFAISSLVDAWALQTHPNPRPFVDALRSEVARLTTLMVDLLEYGRPSGSVRCAQPLAPLFDDAIRACTHEAEAREVRIVGPGTVNADVMVDPRRLVRVFINLIQNAVQHAPAGSEVRVEVGPAKPDETLLNVVVRDCGRGFSADDLPRLFTPFFSRRAGGVGLGLAISERIVSEHGGRIQAANDPAGGAAMTVVLPLVGREPAGLWDKEPERTC